MSEVLPLISRLVDHFRDTGIHTCVLYGSAASGKLGVSSDVDIAIAGESMLAPDELKQYYLACVDTLHREVDLVDLRRVTGIFLTEILTRGRILLNRNPEFLARKAIEMIDYETDLAPAVNAMLKERLRRDLGEW